MSLPPIPPGPGGLAAVVLALVLVGLVCYRLGAVEERAAERHAAFERSLADVVHLASDADLGDAVGLLTAEVRRRLRARGIEPDEQDDQGRDTWKSNR